MLNEWIKALCSEYFSGNIDYETIARKGVH